MATPTGLLLVAPVLLLVTQPRLLLWQEADSSATTRLTQVLLSSPKDPFKEPSQPAMQHPQVALQVLHAAELLPYVEGSWLTLEARIQPALNGTRKLYVDQCVGAQSQHLNRSQRMYSLVFNQGCLSVGSRSGPWSRKDNESLQFNVEVFMLKDDVEEDEVFIICWMSIWSWKRPFEPGRKSCFYNTSSYSWQLADDKEGSSVCDCCDFGCPSPKKGRRKEFPEEGEPHMVIMGPLKVKKPPVSWFKASCRTLKDLLVAVVAFICAALLLILLLLALRKMLQVWPPYFLGSLWGRLKEGSSSPEAQEIGSVARAMEGPLSEERSEGETQSLSEEELETVDPSEGN